MRKQRRRAAPSPTWIVGAFPLARLRAAAIYEPDGPSGLPLALFESGAILLYLADKTGQLISADPNTRYETIRVGDVADGRHRADVWLGRLVQHIRRPRRMKTSARATATQPNRRGCSVSSMNSLRTWDGR